MVRGLNTGASLRGDECKSQRVKESKSQRVKECKCKGEKVTASGLIGVVVGSGGRRGRIPGLWRFRRLGGLRCGRRSWLGVLRGRPSRVDIRLGGHRRLLLELR